MKKQIDDSTIHVYRKPSGYRAMLYAANGEAVSSTRKAYPTLAELAQAMLYAIVGYEWRYIERKGKHYFQCFIYLKGKQTQILRSEPYSSKQKAEQGVQAAYRALTAGRVAKLYSEQTEIVSLESLLTDAKQP